MKNYCRQNDINYIESTNTNEDCLGVTNSTYIEKVTAALLKYLNNVWLGSDIVRHESVQNITRICMYASRFYCN